MKHARPDYDRIQDPWNAIPADEPVFLIRGQDKTAPLLVRLWAMLNQHNGSNPDIIEGANRHADEMQEWQREHGSKAADLPRHSHTDDKTITVEVGDVIRERASDEYWTVSRTFDTTVELVRRELAGRFVGTWRLDTGMITLDEWQVMQKAPPHPQVVTEERDPFTFTVGDIFEYVGPIDGIRFRRYRVDSAPTVTMPWMIVDMAMLGVRFPVLDPAAFVASDDWRRVSTDSDWLVDAEIVDEAFEPDPEPVAGFEPWKYYRHTSGRMMHTMAPTTTKGYGVGLLAETSRGLTIVTRDSLDAVNGWSLTDRKTWDLWWAVTQDESAADEKRPYTPGDHRLGG